MLFAKILKPVFPTCDIICKPYTDADGKTSYRYYSYDTVPTAPAEDETGALVAQILAERLFKDPDRFNNWSTNQQRNTHAHYDFECMPIFFMHPTIYGRSDQFFTLRIRAQIERNVQESAWEHSMDDVAPSDILALREPSRQQFVRALDRLDAWTADEPTMRKIVTSIPIPLSQAIYFPPGIGCTAGDEECYFEHFYGTLRSRIAHAQKIVDTYVRPYTS